VYDDPVDDDVGPPAARASRSSAPHQSGATLRFPLAVALSLSLLAILVLACSALAAPRLYEPSYSAEAVGGFEAGADGSLAPLAGSPSRP
jgi:hypothetical protein